MKSLYIKDKKKRLAFLKLEKKHKILKFLVQKIELNPILRLNLMQKLAKISKKSKFSTTQIKNRCALTYRSHSTLQVFKLSRIRLREFFSLGLVPGYKKAAW